MFSNKMNNSGWILCPSKRFPGKFYYYNVNNGESAWCFNDTEKKFLRIDDKTKLITQKWHCYPEPVSPPGKGHTCLTKSNSPFPQKFGQAIFQKYFSPGSLKPPHSNVLKKPIFGIRNIKQTEVKKKNIDIQTDLPETEIMVQSCKEPLSKRFWKYQNNDTTNTAHTRKINWLPRSNESEDENLDNSNENFLESYKKYMNTTNKGQIEQSVQHSCQSLLLMKQNPDENKTNSLTNLANQVELADNDLRYILQAKRTEKTTVEPQKNTIKKVRFDLNCSVNDNDDDGECGLKNELEARDAFNTTSTKIINKTETVNFVENQLHEDSLKNIKFVVKNSNPKNLFLQNSEEFNPFQFKNENITNFGKRLKNQNVDNSLNLSNQKQYPTSVPGNNDNYDILNEDVLNVIKSIKEKLYVKIPNEQQFSSHSKILFLKSSLQENPFKKYKSKMNPYFKYRSTPKKNISGPYLIAPKKNIGNNYFKVPITNSSEYNKVSTSVNYFDPNFYQNNSNSTNFNNNSISLSDNTNERVNINERLFQNSDSNCKITKENMIFSEKNKNENKNNWLDERLKNFYSRNSYIEKTVVIRMDEIICCFTQIMEDIIYEILETSTCPPPYSLYDAILCLQRKFSDHTHILQVVDKITDLDIFCSKTGYLNDNVHPYELIKAIGCGLIFIEAINALQEFDVKDAESALLHLLRDIDEPQYVELPQPTTTLSRDGNTEQPDRANFIKGRSDILKYLQNHFPEWKNYREDHQIPNTNTGQTVLVTTGKDLHLLKINNKNQMFCEPEEGQKETNDLINTNVCDSNIIRKFHVIEKFENKINEVNTEDIAGKSFDRLERASELNHSKNEKEVNEEIFEEDNGFCNDLPTKMVYEENNLYEGNNLYEENNIYGEDNLYEENNLYKENKNSDESVVFIETENEINDTKHVESPRVDYSTRINESSTITDDFPVLNNDDVTAYYADDANQYYLFVKTFLTELSNSLLLIHSFIKDKVDRFHNTELTDEDKKELHEEANQAYVSLRNIVIELKGIIVRDARDENALRILLIGAEGALQDKRITNYRQVVSKCLEQARQLGGCLRLLLRASDRDCTLSASSDAGDTTCINIFE